ncbi:MAG: hydrolase [Oscillospiraceae bacterium]|jgi:hypothetical protein|nr:hydrolase [Oscillospiraceae bacterium]
MSKTPTQLKDEFLEIYRENVTREGSDKLLEYLLSPASDFFIAPASTRFHGSYAGGLCEHSINVYHGLKDYLARERVKQEYKLEASAEAIAIVALLHDLCKVNCYKVSERNVKDESGKWVKVPFYEYDDKLPYGHGEKSVYIITGFMRLSREESFAIRYHMGFSQQGDDMRNVSAAFEMFPLSLALNICDMEASHMLEERG